jgi:hypothetical protein
MLRSHRLLCGLNAAVMLTLSMISNAFVGLGAAAVTIGRIARDFVAIAFDPRPAVERTGLPLLVETESAARSLGDGQVLNFRKRRINRPDVGRWSDDNPSISFAA